MCVGLGEVWVCVGEGEVWGVWVKVRFVDV